MAEKISEAASQQGLRQRQSDIVGDKFKRTSENADLGEIAENAKDYARKNPVQCNSGSRRRQVFVLD